jgi:hypothetical protein
MCIKHRSAQFVHFILFAESILLSVSVSWEPAAAVEPHTSTPMRGAEDLSSHQYERAVFTVRRILLLSSTIPVPASSHQYERAEAATSLQFRLCNIQQRVYKIFKPSHSLAGLRLRESISSALY